MTSNSPHKDLFLYLHFPFCQSKCHFCDWVQEIPKSDLLAKPENNRRQAYVHSLCAEIRHRGADLVQAGYRAKLLYFGGGTASTMTEAELEKVFGALQDTFYLKGLDEATIECSPESISAEKLALCRQLGFDRFSMGVQSMDDDRLRKLGRLHSADSVRTAISLARAAGFDNINVDLMCGFPSEVLTEVAQSIKAGLALEVSHITLYPFRPTPGTVLRRQIDRMGAQAFLRHQQIAFSLARKMVESAGYEEYATGYFGRLALNVVRPFGLDIETAGFGSGAVSYIDGHYLVHAKGKLTEYIACPSSFDYCISLAASSVALSMLRAGLSLFDGVSAEGWQTMTGRALSEVLADPDISGFLGYLRGPGALVEDEIGIRLPRDRAAATLLKLNADLYLDAPAHPVQNQRHAQ